MLVSAVTLFVDGQCHQFFAGTTFALYEYSSICSGDLSDRVKQFLQVITTANDPPESLAGVLMRESAPAVLRFSMIKMLNDSLLKVKGMALRNRFTVSQLAVDN